MNFALMDIAVLAAFLLFIILGFKNGVIKSFLQLINSVVSWLFSLYISKFAAGFVYEYFVSPSIIRSVESSINEKGLNSSYIIDKLPKFLLGLLPDYGITMDKITHIINSVSKEVLPKEISRILMPVITDILKPVILVLLFAALFILGRILTHFVLKMFKLKSLNYSDKILGGIFGLFKGYVAVLVFACMVRAFVPFLDDEKQRNFVSETISSTVIFKGIYTNNPLYTMFRKV